MPRARKTEIAGTREGALLVRLAAPPVEGAANEALVEYLSKQFELPRRAVRIVSGDKSRTKRVAIDGVSEAQARSLLHV